MKRCKMFLLLTAAVLMSSGVPNVNATKNELKDYEKIIKSSLPIAKTKLVKQICELRLSEIGNFLDQYLSLKDIILLAPNMKYRSKPKVTASNGASLNDMPHNPQECNISAAIPLEELKQKLDEAVSSFDMAEQERALLYSAEDTREFMIRLLRIYRVYGDIVYK